MPKGYMSFEDFKTNKGIKEKKWRCPKCHRYVSDTVRNIFGKRMCLDCYYEEEMARKKNSTKLEEPEDEEVQDTYSRAA